MGVISALCWSLCLERSGRTFEDQEEYLEEVWDGVRFRVAWQVQIIMSLKPILYQIWRWSCIM